MTFEELDIMFKNKYVDHISTQNIDGKIYIRFHLGNPNSQFVEKLNYNIPPENIKEFIAPGEDEDILDCVYDKFRTLKYFDKQYYYNNYIIIIDGWVKINIDEGNIDPDNDTLVALIGGNYSSKEYIEFINSIFIGSYIVNIKPYMDNKNGTIESISIVFSNGLEISDFTNFLDHYSVSQIYLTDEKNKIFYAFSKDGIIEKELGSNTTK